MLSEASDDTDTDTDNDDPYYHDDSHDTKNISDAELVVTANNAVEEVPIIIESEEIADVQEKAVSEEVEELQEKVDSLSVEDKSKCNHLVSLYFCK